MFKLLIILPCLMMMFQPLNAKVETPNYNFSLDTLADFYPEKNRADLEKKYGKAEVMDTKNGVETLKFYVAHIRYKFPVLVQVKEGKVLDFFARLPSYFLHDIFFQSLVNRMGKQKDYKRVIEEAVYSWEKDSLKHVYSASCTITCFPIFYTVFPLESKNGFKPILQKMKESIPKN
jgi:hypothetical protein